MPARRRHLRWIAAMLALAIAGCSYVSPGVGVGSVLGYEGLGRQIETFYRQRAWERNATCTLPEIDAILRAEIVEEREDELTILVRYSWRDNARDFDDRGTRAIPGRIGGGTLCRGIDQRRFTLERVDGGVRVVGMSGPQRPNPIGR